MDPPAPSFETALRASSRHEAGYTNHGLALGEGAPPARVGKLTINERGYPEAQAAHIDVLSRWSAAASRPGAAAICGPASIARFAPAVTIDIVLTPRRSADVPLLCQGIRMIRPPLVDPAATLVGRGFASWCIAR